MSKQYFASFGNYILEKPELLWAERAQRRYGLCDKCWAAMVLPFFPSSLGRIIDIGANIGDTAAIIRSYRKDNEIVCIEGDPKFLYYLNINKNIIGDVFVLDRYFDHKGEMATNLIETHGHPLFIKTDTDGLDCDIVNSFMDVGDFNYYFEFDPSLTVERAGVDKTPELLLRLVGRRYSLIFFSNWGEPISCYDADSHTPYEIVTDMNAKLKNHDNVCFYDIWAFEPKSVDVYNKSKEFINKFYLEFLK